MNKIFDWVFIVLTFALTMSALGVVGSFEQGNIDFTGFFIAAQTEQRKKLTDFSIPNKGRACQCT